MRKYKSGKISIVKSKEEYKDEISKNQNIFNKQNQFNSKENLVFNNKDNISSSSRHFTNEFIQSVDRNIKNNNSKTNDTTSTMLSKFEKSKKNTNAFSNYMNNLLKKKDLINGLNTGKSSQQKNIFYTKNDSYSANKYENNIPSLVSPQTTLENFMSHYR